MHDAEPLTIPPLPMPMRWIVPPVDTSWSPGNRALTIEAAPRTDWFIDPAGGAPMRNAACLVGEPAGDFVLQARVSVDFSGTFDAGVLLLFAGPSSWAKLCFEYSPDRLPMVVSVVTRGVSDDCNSVVVDGAVVWLRVARIGSAFAFHASTDGGSWQFVRHFTLEADLPIGVGFEAQSPMGDGTTVTFDEIGYEARTLADLRDGS
jgi:regulation of enolase protein 1 (concanavalin A-like superfamily)